MPLFLILPSSVAETAIQTNYLHLHLVLRCGPYAHVTAVWNMVKQDINYIYYMKGLNNTGIYSTDFSMLFRHYSDRNYTNI